MNDERKNSGNTYENDRYKYSDTSLSGGKRLVSDQASGRHPRTGTGGENVFAACSVSQFAGGRFAMKGINTRGNNLARGNKARGNNAKGNNLKGNRTA
jgi:hypothetical protein